MSKNYKKEKGHIYIARNDDMPDLIKIGETNNVETRMRILSNFTGVPSKFYAWKVFPVRHPKAVEKILHDKFEEYRYNKEFFKIKPLKASNEITKVLKVISVLKNTNKETLKNAIRDNNSSSTNSAKKSLWTQIKRDRKTDFVKEAIDLCLKEKRYGQPQYDRFAAFRSKKITGISNFDLYICAKHLRIVTTTPNKNRARKIIKESISSDVDIFGWEKGVSFNITTKQQFSKLKSWLKMGKVLHKSKA